ncbi:MAG: Ig-like domain-containing protein [Gemmatimonadetes bacterium]|nr:Ig-like domain-containing protein [Gemmatimonadota bacterium]
MSPIATARRWIAERALPLSRALRGVGVATLLVGASACATDQPAAVEQAQPARIALNASVAASSRAGLAQVRVSAAYIRQGGSTVPMGGPQTLTLGSAATQQVPITLDVGPCLADDTRAGINGGAAAADECVLRLDLELLLDGVVVDRQVLTNISVKPGQVATVAQPVALSDIIQLRLVLPAANVVGPGQPLRLEAGKTMSLVLDVRDAQQQPVAGRTGTWRSSNPAVASVDANGVVTGVAAGRATITVDVGTQSVSVDVNVVPPPQVVTVTAGGTSGSGAVSSVPAGITCAVQGAATTGTCSAAFPGDVAVQIVASPATGTDFLSFTGDCAVVQGTNCQVSTAPSRRVTVSFRARHTVRVDASGNGSGVITANSGGIDCAASNAVSSGSCSGNYPDGTVVTLTASPTNGSTFGGWSGACTGTTPTCTVTASAALTTTARFDRLGSLVIAAGAGNGTGAITSSPAGLNCAVVNGAASGTCAVDFPVGTSVTLTATAAAGHVLNAWGAACAQAAGATCTVNVSAGQNTASVGFTAPVSLSVALSGTGGGQVSGGPIACTLANNTTTGTCSANVPRGVPVTLTATPDGTSDFTGWSGACSGTGSCTVTPQQAASVSAAFKRKQVTLTVTAGGPGGGSLAVSAGNACVVSEGAGDQTCTYLVDVGTTVTLGATPGTYQRFTGWSGACTGTGSCSVLVDQARSVRGAFTRRQVTLTLIANGPGGGSVTTNTGLTCIVVDGGPARTCTQLVDAGRVVQLAGSAAQYGVFGGFTGSCSGINTCQLLPDQQDLTVTAGFTRRQVTVTLTITGSGAGSIAPGALTPCAVSENSAGRFCTWQVDAGKPLTFTATPTGSVMQFDGFTGDCSGTNPCTVTPDQPVAIGASFARRTVLLSLTLNGTGSGSVQVNALPPCTISANSTPTLCTRTVPMGLPVTLTATPTTHFSFTGFTGDCATVTNVCTFTPLSAAAVTGTFSPLMVNITLSRAAGAGGVGSILMGVGNQRCNITLTGTSGNCVLSVQSGTTVTLNVDPSIGNGLLTWGGACLSFGGSNACTITPTANTQVTAQMQ